MGDQFHFHPDSYLEMARSEVPAYDALQHEIARATSDIAAARILDLGSGTGETMRAVGAVHPAAELIGVDESDGMLQAARELLPGADFRVARLQDRLPEGPFDLVVSALAIHHLDDGEKADLFARVFAVLRDGGRFVLGDVVKPVDPADVVTPIDEGFDKPSPARTQLSWMTTAGFDATIRWQQHDLVVIAADRAAK